MRIIHVSDLHYTLAQLDWVVEEAEHADLVVVSGDSLDIASAVPLTTQAVVIAGYAELIAERTRLVISSGNHDLTGPDAVGEQAALWIDEARAVGAVVDGARLDLGDVRVTVCPWWDGPFGRERVVEQLARDGADRPGTWVWVYHWPPVGSTTCWTGRDHYGDPDLAGWIGEHHPDVVLTGHVHESPFKPGGSWAEQVGPTWVLNPGRQTGPRPTFVELDLAARVATWRSLAGTETVQLGRLSSG
jgi:Icc-related predicted phosphoesterase